MGRLFACRNNDTRRPLARLVHGITHLRQNRNCQTAPAIQQEQVTQSEEYIPSTKQDTPAKPEPTIDQATVKPSDKPATESSDKPTTEPNSKPDTPAKPAAKLADKPSAKSTEIPTVKESTATKPKDTPGFNDEAKAFMRDVFQTTREEQKESETRKEQFKIDLDKMLSETSSKPTIKSGTDTEGKTDEVLPIAFGIDSTEKIADIAPLIEAKTETTPHQQNKDETKALFDRAWTESITREENRAPANNENNKTQTVNGEELTLITTPNPNISAGFANNPRSLVQIIQLNELCMLSRFNKNQKAFEGNIDGVWTRLTQGVELTDTQKAVLAQHHDLEPLPGTDIFYNPKRPNSTYQYHASSEDDHSGALKGLLLEYDTKGNLTDAAIQTTIGNRLVSISSQILTDIDDQEDKKSQIKTDIETLMYAIINYALNDRNKTATNYEAKKRALNTRIKNTKSKIEANLDPNNPSHSLQIQRLNDLISYIMPDPINTSSD